MSYLYCLWSSSESVFLRLGQIRKTVFRVTPPYLNLMVKPGVFFRFSGKNIILCILKGEMNYIFFQKKIVFKKMCVPTLPKVSDLLPEKSFFFYLALV